MREFFMGWKRKVGVVTLVMALVGIYFWVRSIGYIDRVMITSRKSLIFFESVRQSFAWSRFQLTENDWGENFDFRWQSIARGSDPNDTVHSLETVPHWHCSGFHIVSGDFIEDCDQTLLVIPDWSIILPLTLFSAYLLLCKPRNPVPKKAAEPIPEMAA
jgi:hypothetical protein